MPLDTSALASPLDETALEAMSAGMLELEKAASILADAQHRIEVASACSDMTDCIEAGRLITEALLLLSVRHGTARALIQKETARARARGIRARTKLPSPTYDHLFTTMQSFGRTLCVMVPGSLGYDKDFWEEVPAP